MKYPNPTAIPALGLSDCVLETLEHPPALVHIANEMAGPQSCVPKG